MLPPGGFATLPISDGCTGDVASGFPSGRSNSGGHNDVHPPTHLTVPPFSGKNTYRVRPFPLTKTAPIPPGTLWVAILLIPWFALLAVEADAVAVVGVPAGVDLLGDELLLPQAAASRASGTTSRA
jgi:hypothetical protein